MAPATTDEARRLRAAVRALVRRFSIGERADVSCCGMTVAQAATLELLTLTGPSRLGELGRRLGISASTLSRNLSRLEERGLVETFPDPADRRASLARLTAAGRKAASSVERQEVRFAESVLEQLPASRRREVTESLDTLLGAVRTATESCCPGAFDHLMEDFPRQPAAMEPRR
jgi:DNA-binding MarR family transcriptional regulator